jgi:hypothetical protein
VRKESVFGVDDEQNQASAEAGYDECKIYEHGVE